MEGLFQSMSNPVPIQTILFRLKKYFSFVKFEHTLFSLPLIYSGVFLASKSIPSMKLLGLVLLAGIGARTAALTLNRLIDREIDRRNPRTVHRELPSGRMTSPEAAILLLFGVVIYGFAAYSISTFTFYISPIPLVIFIGYPYMKRFTRLAHFGVGLGLSMAPLGGWFAVKQSFDGLLPGALLSVFTLLWVSGFDIIYSTLDEDFDRRENLHSFVAHLGKERALTVSSWLHGLAFAVLAILFFYEIRAWIAAPLLLVTGALLYMEQRRAADVELAFFRINAVLGFAVFGMVFVGVL